jgi:hypothetical protein
MDGPAGRSLPDLICLSTDVDADAQLRRLERTAIVVCLLMTAAALILARGRLGPALGVLGGGLLIGVSYWTIGSSVTALAKSSGRGSAARPRIGWIVVKVTGRYALLTLLAYVMIARLRLHPVGLLAGASSVVAAASIEAIRLLLKKT